ncbi:MAG: hypothetical protein ACM31C_30415 [Acidobacteriota bacterium]
MAFHRPFIFAALLPASLIACGSDSGQPVPQGAHYHYVVNQINVPTNNTQSRAYGLDLNGDGTVDNQLGMVLGTLVSTAHFDIQGNINTAVADGSIILLADFQTKDFTNTTAAGISAYLGTNPMPAACNGSADTTCQHHLTGSASFDLSANQPTNAALAGKIVNGTFTGGPGHVSLQIALGGTGGIELDLIGARAKASDISDTAIGSTTMPNTATSSSSGGVILAGAVTQDDLNNKIIPAVASQIAPIVVRDCCGTGNTAHPTCDPNATPNACYCADGSTGKTILGLFDTSPKDCAVTTDEISSNSLIMSLLAPDVTIEGKMALSLGINVTAVGATFTPPGQ